MSLLLRLLSGEQTLIATGIASSEAFGAPRLDHNLTATGIASSEALGTPSLVQNLVATGIAGSEALGTPSLNQNLTATGSAGSEALGTPTLILNLVVTAGSPESDGFGSPAVSLAVVEPPPPITVPLRRIRAQRHKLGYPRLKRGRGIR